MPPEAKRKVLIQSFDDNDYTINTSTTTLNLPELSPNQRAIVVTAGRSEHQVQSPTTIELELQTETRLAHASKIKIHLSKFLFTMASEAWPICQLNSQNNLCTLVDNDSEFFVIQMDMDCAGSLCPDQHVFTVSISGLSNRHSTARGALPYKEVFFETFDPTGLHKVDISEVSEFIGDLTPGSISLIEDSIAFSEKQVGQLTDFSFSLEYAGLRTDQGDSI